MNLVMCFGADRVNLWSKLLSRSIRILIQQHLDLIVMFLQQRPYLLLLCRCQFQIFRKVGKLLVDRLRRMDVLQLLTRGGLLNPLS